PHLANDDWYVVPDNVAFDADGHFTLLGRSDRIAKIEGKRISLVGIEALLLQSGLVADVRVLQLESARDEIGAVIVPNENGWSVLRTAQTRGLRAKLDVLLNNSVERIAHPRRWRWVDALPVNDVGKTSNAAVLELFAAAGLHFPAVHVLESSPDKVTFELYVSPHLSAFDGHFPGIPVLAGVVQTDWAICLARKAFGVDLQFDRMEAIKFLRVYQPGDLLTVELQWKAERRLLSFRFDSGSTAHSSGRIFFKP
ncbi:MAG: AMP-binding protein, partial [Gemmatimonadaceae bacterium]